MGDRRPLAAYTSEDFDLPRATITLAENVTTRLDRLRRTLERHREESRRESESMRDARWGDPPSHRRRRLRPAGSHPATFEGRRDRYYFHSSESSEEEDARPRSAKRRKLDHFSSPADHRSYKYGHYGQVEPGHLKLDLYSCDGGVHNENGPINYGASNIIKHDQSVYCSEAPRCNIILQHHDRSAFCLEKLFIIAPNNGFTAPVREGTVTIAMSVEELCTLTEQIGPSDYLRPPTTSAPSPPREDRDGQRLSLLESLRDPHISSAVAPENPQDFSPFGWTNDLQRDDAQESWNDDDELEWRAPERDNEWRAPPPRDTEWPPLQPTVSRQRQTYSRDNDEPSAECVLESGLHVTMLNDEEVAWPEEPTAAAVLADRHRRMRTMRMDEDDEAWDRRFRSLHSRLRRGRRPDSQRPDQRQSTISADKPSTATANERLGVTQVKFHIKRESNRVAIKFDPPVSGTSILLQLKAASHDDNIDIQSVLACGYAGPRFFPAHEFR